MFRVKNEEEFILLGPGDLSPERQPDGRDSSEKAMEMIQAAVKEGYGFFDWTHKRMDGEEFPATILLSRIGQGEGMILLATVRDVAQEKRAANELKAKVAELERFNKFAVGRELKMVELKAQVKALQEKSGREG
jgi:predicted aldo/keto reductase-like oxidoreductase